MNRLFCILALLGAVFFTATPAQAAHHHRHVLAATGCYDASPGVVTQYEYNHATVGMTRDEVACLFGTTGTNAHFLGNDTTKTVVEYPFFDGRTVTILYQITSTGQVLIEKSIS